jgi:hypothetical protein
MAQQENHSQQLPEIICYVYNNLLSLSPTISFITSFLPKRTFHLSHPFSVYTPSHVSAPHLTPDSRLPFARIQRTEAGARREMKATTTTTTAKKRPSNNKLCVYIPAYNGIRCLDITYEIIMMCITLDGYFFLLVPDL